MYRDKYKYTEKNTENTIKDIIHNEKEGIIKKKIYERRAYESVDEKSLS